MWTNILILGFLGGMVYWWGMVQGLFSGFLHLLAVVVAGSLAIAFWEPIAGILLGTMPAQAWGVSLLGPFVLILLVVRMVLDKMIPYGMYFDKITDMVGGGACGLFAAVLTAGITIMGISGLAVQSVGDYKPYSTTNEGFVQFDGGLWVPVDSITSGFFGMLSGGAFYSGQPVNLYMEDLKLASGTRLVRPDPFASNVVLPGSVQLGKVYEPKLPVRGVHSRISRTLGEKGKAIVVETLWNNDAGKLSTYDEDGALRVSPAQIRLISWRYDARNVPVEANISGPVAWSQDYRGQRRFFKPDRLNVAAAGQNAMNIAWTFRVPNGYSPIFLMVRGTRMVLPEKRVKTHSALQQALGKWSSGGGGPGNGGGPTPSGKLAEEILATSKLPNIISKNFASGMKFDDKTKTVISGERDVKVSGRPSDSNRVEFLFVPKHQGMVRVEMTKTQLVSIFGRSPSGESRKLPFYISGVNESDRYYCAGWIIERKRNESEFKIVRPQTMRTGNDLPIDKMENNHKLHLYFIVPVNTNITGFHIGKQRQTVSLNVGTVKTIFDK